MAITRREEITTLVIQKQIGSSVKLGEGKEVAGFEEFCKARNENVSALEKEAQDLLAMHKDLAGLVKDQQDGVNTIQKNLESTAQQAAQADRMLTKAENSSRCTIL